MLGADMYYDREGKPISLHEYARLIEQADYKRVAQDTIGPYWVSTVWLGINHNFLRQGAPVIFETMVFLNAEHQDPQHRALHDMDCQRYATEEQARKGHDDMCTLVRATVQEDFWQDAACDE